jgi:hypothetical protein
MSYKYLLPCSDVKYCVSPKYDNPKPGYCNFFVPKLIHAAFYAIDRSKKRYWFKRSVYQLWDEKIAISRLMIIIFWWKWVGEKVFKWGIRFHSFLVHILSFVDTTKQNVWPLANNIVLHDFQTSTDPKLIYIWSDFGTIFIFFRLCSRHPWVQSTHSGLRGKTVDIYNFAKMFHLLWNINCTLKSLQKLIQPLRK